MQDITLKPRKLPRQARSSFTVGAIIEATFQLVRSRGVCKLTTTGVSERAGVSVGTFYQYFPHKNALLFAMVRRHMEALGAAFGGICARSEGKPLDAVVYAVVTGYCDLKLARARDRRSLYDTAIELGMDDIRASIAAGMDRAVARALATARDATVHDPDTAAAAFMAALRGTARELIDDSETPATPDVLCAEAMDAAHRALAAFLPYREPA